MLIKLVHNVPVVGTSSMAVGDTSGYLSEYKCQLKKVMFMLKLNAQEQLQNSTSKDWHS